MSAPVTVVLATGLPPDVSRHAAEQSRPGETPWLSGLDVAVRTTATAQGSEVRLEADLPRRVVPFFGFFVDPLLRRSVRRHLRRCAGDDLPAPRFTPPAAATLAQIRSLATLTFVLAVVGYGAALFTQTIDYVARSFGATDAALGNATAATRIGSFAALAGAVLADRSGRRRVIVWSTAVVCVATMLCSAAPSLVAMTVLQTVVRFGANVAAVVTVIALTEEAPDGGRAFTIALSGIAASAGFAAGSLLLPAADLHPDAWRVLYAAGGLGLVFIPGIARRLTETARFAALLARRARGHVSEIVDRTYGRRFFVLVALAFLFNASAAPSSQFANRYLASERHFSGFDILVLRLVTQTVTAVAASWAGGVAAEKRGRRPVAAAGLAVLAAAEAAFYLSGGPALWVALGVATVAVAFAGPSLAAFNTELFPTEVRGTAGAGLLAAAVTGAVVGLLAAGRLADSVADVGVAVAVVAAVPLALMVPLLRWLPEARGHTLEDISPSEV